MTEDTGNSGAPVAAVETSPQESKIDASIPFSKSMELAEQAAVTKTEEETKQPQSKLPEKPEGDDGENSEAPKKMGGFQRKLAARDAEIAELRRQVEQYAPKPQPEASADQPVVSDGRPDPAKFEDVFEYLAAEAKWAAKSELTEQQTQAKALAEKQLSEAEFNREIELHDQREAEFVKEHPDYQEKLDQAVTMGLVDESGIKAVLKSDMSEKVAYYLLNNPSDALAFKGYNAEQKAAAVKVIENALKSQSAGQEAVERTTRAAPPISPVKSQATSTSKSPTEMSVQELEKWRYGAAAKQ